MKVTEKDIGNAAAEWLQSEGWDVYEEVEISRGVADVFGVCDKKFAIIETKTSWSMGLLSQCLDRTMVAHHVWACASQGSFRDGHPPGVSKTFLKLAQHLNIGVLAFNPDVDVEKHGLVASIREIHPAPLGSRRLVSQRYLWKSDLPPAQSARGKGYAGAGSQAGRFTPFRETCFNLLAYVQKNNGCTLKQALDNVKTHYSSRSSAMSTLPKRLRQGFVHGIESRIVGGKTCLFLKVDK